MMPADAWHLLIFQRELRVQGSRHVMVWRGRTLDSEYARNGSYFLDPVRRMMARYLQNEPGRPLFYILLGSSAAVFAPNQSVESDLLEPFS